MAATYPPNRVAQGPTERLSSSTLGPAQYDADTGKPTPSTWESWRKLFGEPMVKNEQDPYAESPVDVDVLHEAWRGKNTFIPYIIRQNILESENVFYKRILPLKKYLGGTITVTQLIFDQHVLVREPELGVAPNVQHSFRQETFSVPRYGLGFEMENGFAMTEKGLMTYKESIHQLECAVHNTLLPMIILAILNAPPVAANWYEAFNVPMPEPTLTRVFEEEQALFGALNKTPDAIHHLMAKAKQIMLRRNVKADTLIVPSGVVTHYKLHHLEEADYSRKGERGPARFESEGGPFVAAAGGLTIIESPLLFTGVGDQGEDLFIRDKAFGEHAVVDARWYRDVPPEEYRSSMLDVSVLDYESDQLRRISIRDALYNCGVFSEDGESHGPIFPALFAGFPTLGDYLDYHGILQTFVSSLNRPGVAAQLKQSLPRLFANANNAVPSAALRPGYPSSIFGMGPTGGDADEAMNATATTTTLSPDELIAKFKQLPAAEKQGVKPKEFSAAVKGTTTPSATIQGIIDALQTTGSIFTDAMVVLPQTDAQDNWSDARTNFFDAAYHFLNVDAKISGIAPYVIANCDEKHLQGYDSLFQQLDAALAGDDPDEKHTSDAARVVLALGKHHQATELAELGEALDDPAIKFDFVAHPKEVVAAAEKQRTKTIPTAVAGTDAIGYATAKPILDIKIDDLTRSFFDRLIDLNVYFPINFIYERLHVRVQTGSMVVMKSGEETGNAYVGFSDMQMGTGVNRKVLQGHMTVFLRAIVQRPENVLVFPNTSIHGYTGGGNMKFFNASKRAVVRAYLDGRNLDDNSMFAFAIPASECPSIPIIDVTGQYPISMMARENELPPHYSTAEAYTKLWNFRANSSYFDTMNKFQRPLDMNTRSAQMTQFCVRYLGKHMPSNPMGCRIAGTSHLLGPTVYPGFRRDVTGAGRGMVDNEYRYDNVIDMALIPTAHRTL